MNYKYDDSGITKFEYACYLAASLTYLMLKQRDSAGLAVFDTHIREYIPPRGAATHLHAIMSTLESIQPGEETSISATFNELAQTDYPSWIGHRNLRPPRSTVRSAFCP